MEKQSQLTNGSPASDLPVRNHINWHQISSRIKTDIASLMSLRQADLTSDKSSTVLNKAWLAFNHIRTEQFSPIIRQYYNIDKGCLSNSTAKIINTNISIAETYAEQKEKYAVHVAGQADKTAKSIIRLSPAKQYGQIQANPVEDKIKAYSNSQRAFDDDLVKPGSINIFKHYYIQIEQAVHDAVHIDIPMVF